MSREEPAPGLRVGAHLVHEAAETQRPGAPHRRATRGRPAPRREAPPPARQRARPAEHQPGQHELPLHRRNGGRQLGRLEVEELGLVLVDVAERADFRQQQRPAEARQKALADGARGAPRRQIERHVGEREGIVGRNPAISRPSSSAATSVSRNGAPGGMVKTFGLCIGRCLRPRWPRSPRSRRRSQPASRR